ncbi:hypothetical protein EGH21_22280 [Halomicroarcula sp. F13]|uniref:PH domain-containing protein n=1 Tax=Haloarcula rubra TaxID=2487747 RepID=A0AAW4PVP3_9EURY|nr:hypothetical protein [Halomicroarcula rubra]MBX0325748.1 hypothetical protein [Halomicroarcula rubra]
MIGPTTLLVWTAGGAVAGAVFLSGLGIYLTAASFRRRVIWEDDATLIGKTRTVARYTYRNADWSELPATAGYGAAIGGGAVLILSLLAIGAMEVLQNA